MINEQHEERKSEQNTGHDRLLINENSSSDSSRKDSAALITGKIDSDLKTESENDSIVLQRPHDVSDLSVINSDVEEEIRDIVQTIAKAVFCIIDNNIDQLANRSSNTFGMRVKDSLILKAQQTHRREISLDELKTSLECRLIVDDDLQIGFLRRIESLAPSSDSENPSTKPKKSVSLAEEVEVFDRVENEFLTENEVDFLSDSVDIQNDRIMDHGRSSKNDDEMYNEEKNSFSPVESESFSFNEYNILGDLRGSESHTSSKVLKKFHDSVEDLRILSDTHLILDRMLGVRNSSIGPSANENQIIVRLVETTVNELRDQFENCQTELIDRRNEAMSKRPETVNEDGGESAVYAKEEIDQRDSSASMKKQSSEQSSEKSESTRSKMPDNSYKDDINSGFSENSSAIDVLKAEEDVRKESSVNDPRRLRSHKSTKSSTEILDIENNEEKKRTEKIKKLTEKTTGDKSKGEHQAQAHSQSTQSLKNSKQESSTVIGLVEMDSASAKLDPGQPVFESNDEDKIPEKGTLSANFSAEISLDDEKTFMPEAQFNLKRSPDFAHQKLNDSEISQEKNLPDSLSKGERVDKEGGPATSSPRNSSSPKKTTSEISLNANKVSKKSSRTDQQSTNDPSSKETSSKVSQKASKLSGKFSRTDTSELIISGPNNSPLAAETLLVYSTDGNVTNPAENLHVADTRASENQLELTKNSKTKKESEGSLKKMQTQVYPAAVDNILQLDLPSTTQRIVDTKVSQEQDIDPIDENDKAERKTNPLLGKKSSAKLNRDEEEISDRGSVGNYVEDSAKEQTKRKKSMLNVVSKFSMERDGGVSDNLQPENDRDDESSKSFLNLEAGKPQNKSEDALIGSVNSNFEQLRNPLELSVNTKKRNRFIQALKRSLQSKKNRSKRSGAKSEKKLEVCSESQTDMDEETDPELSTEVEDGHDTDKLTRSSQLIETKPSRLSATIKEDFSIDGTQRSMSHISKQLSKDTPRSLVEVYSVAVDSDLNQNRPSTCKITDLSTSLDHSRDLSETNIYNMDERDKKAFPREVELIPKSSKDLGSKPLLTEEGNSSPKIDKSFAKLLQKMYLENSSEQTPKKLSNLDEVSESKNPMNDSKTEEKSSKSARSVQKGSSEEINFRDNGPIEYEEISQSDSKSGTDKTTIQNSDSVLVAYLVKPSTQNQPEEKSVIDDKVQSNSTLIENETVEEESRDITRQDLEKRSLLSNIKSIFKSANRSEPRKRSIASIGDPQDADIINQSLHSLKTNNSGASASGIQVVEEQSSHFTRESVEVSTIQSSKSLEDNRKRSKNRQRAGHKLLDDEDIAFVTENLVTKSYQATTQSDFIRRRNKEKTEAVGVDGESHCSEGSIAESNLQTLLSDEEEVEEQTEKIFNRRKKSKQKENPEGNTRRFEISLSRIFSNSSRKRNTVNESRATANSETSPEDHFQITKIPLSSSDDSNAQGNEFKITKQRSDAMEDNREEVVAIRSLESTHDLDNQTATKESIEKRSSRILEPKCTTNISNDQLFCPSQSGTFIYSAPIVANQISSENELAEKNSLNNVQEARKPAEKVYVAKGTIVSYAPMVESAKYIPADELDDRSDEDDQSENRQKISSGKSFATIRKLFSRSSIKGGQDHATVEDHSVDHADHETKKGSKRSGKSSIIKHRKEKDHSVGQLSEAPERESVMSAKISPAKSTKDDEAEDKERKTNHPEITEQLSKSKVNDVECPAAYSEVLLVNTVAIGRNESANIQSRKNYTDDREYGSKQVVTKFDEVDIAGNKVKPNHGGLKPREIVEHVVVDEIVISHGSQTDFNNSIDVEQKLIRRSNHTKKGSLLSMAKSYIKGHTKTATKEMEGPKRLTDGRNHDENLVTLATEDVKETLKEQGVAKTESVLSRGLKRLFKKRSSVVDPVASNSYVEDPADDLSQLDVQTLPDLAINDTTDLTMLIGCPESRESESKGRSDDTQFAVYNAKSKTKFPTNLENGSRRMEDKNVQVCLYDIDTSKSKSTVSLLTSIAKKSIDTLSKAESHHDKHSSIKYESTNKVTEIELSAALANSRVHIATSFQTRNNPESEARVNQDENVAQNQSRSKIGSKDFRLNPSFASRRSTVVMMATPVQPRKEPQAEVSNHSNHQRDESSSSPTAFYYLLGPSLDEALVDVRVVFQNLIDKITGRGR